MRIHIINILLIAVSVNLNGMDKAAQQAEYLGQPTEPTHRIRQTSLRQLATLEQNIAQEARQLETKVIAFTDNYFEYLLKTACTTSENLEKIKKYSMPASLKGNICASTALIWMLACSDSGGLYQKIRCLQFAIATIPDIKLIYYVDKNGDPAFNNPPLPSDMVKKDCTSGYKKKMTELTREYEKVGFEPKQITPKNP